MTVYKFRISNSSQISFKSQIRSNRKIHKRFLSRFLTVDGTDFPIEEPTPFSEHWYSHKFNGPGLRHEVAVSTENYQIVWVNGPFLPGKCPDVKMLRENLKTRLLPRETVATDDG